MPNSIIRLKNNSIYVKCQITFVQGRRCGCDCGQRIVSCRMMPDLCGTDYAAYAWARLNVSVYPSEPRSDPGAGGRRELIWEFLEIDGNITIRAQIPQIWEVKKALCLCGWVLDSCFPVCSLPNKWVALRPERTQPWERHAQARSDGYYAPPGFTSRYPEPSKRYHRRPGSDYMRCSQHPCNSKQLRFLVRLSAVIPYEPRAACAISRSRAISKLVDK